MPRRLPAAILPQQRQRQLQYAYGKTHVAVAKPQRLPPPVIPTYPQKVTLSDGSTFMHWTTSPKSSIRLTRDISNSPLWTLSTTRSGQEEDVSGRLGRFQSRFNQGGGLDGYTLFDEYAQRTPSKS
ncbi:hypothetical protein FRB91_002505 [Serendipita sp. 411]|nr:hypothetical protein FRC15_002480 [Serendipita sp. 397]KAG8803737.1 hypothetical protein FRC16_003277 [Serendipita sp. 398]KAG8827343.1 hypothetical protein FRC19_003920 [Serendipita sp. 401]KAG8860618.1 hypothetical protein FRB91_002505 [Serendipita sp. 411]KAG8875128.1 hypothetical protein FRC20_004453 [Serendipita sp. 405]KAG9057698.1 hypothetical protein FS842_004617 [Serendipita sp. 407]